MVSDPVVRWAQQHGPFATWLLVMWFVLCLTLFHLLWMAWRTHQHKKALRKLEGLEHDAEDCADEAYHRDSYDESEDTGDER